MGDTQSTSVYMLGLTSTDPDVFSATLKMVEEDLIRQRRDFEGCRALYETLLVLDHGTPSRTVEVGLALFNAARRIPNANVRELFALADGVEAAINCLSEDERDKPLAFLCYQRGILARDYMMWGKAAEFQERAASLYALIGDTTNTAISRYLMCVEELNQAFFTGEGIDELVGSLTSIFFPQACENLQGNAWLPNVYIHMGLALLWRDDQFYNHPRWTEIMLYLQSLTGDTATAQVHWIRLFEAASAMQHDPFESDYIELLKEVADRRDTDKNGDVTVTAYLLLARIHGSETPKWFELAGLWNNLKGRVPQAIARREEAEYFPRGLP